MDKDWRKIKTEMEQYCTGRCTETGVPFTFSKRNIVHHLKLERDEDKGARYALVSLQRDGKIVKHGAHVYRWNIV